MSLESSVLIRSPVEYKYLDSTLTKLTPIGTAESTKVTDARRIFLLNAKARRPEKAGWGNGSEHVNEMVDTVHGGLPAHGRNFRH